MHPKKIVITGGGTGGHVFPALSMAAEFQRRGFKILYVGTAQGMEAKLVPEKGYPFFTLKTGSVKNQSRLKIIKSLFQLFFAVFWALRFLKKERPVAVIGVGGYVSVPVCFAAFLLRLPLYLQEQNVSVGIANRFLGRLARKVFLGFEEAEKCFPAGKCLVTGNPLREAFYDSAFPRYDAASNCLVILGGSQGAKAINDAIVDFLPRFEKEFPGLKIIHQTGQKDFEATQKGYAGYKGSAEVKAFIAEMPALYAKASLVIARSGALTVSELIQCGRPAIFVPYPRLGQNDQTANAYLLQSHGVARVVEQGEAFKERLWTTLSEVFHEAQLKKMNAQSLSLKRQNALTTIGDTIEADQR